MTPNDRTNVSQFLRPDMLFNPGAMSNNPLGPNVPGAMLLQQMVRF